MIWKYYLNQQETFAKNSQNFMKNIKMFFGKYTTPTQTRVMGIKEYPKEIVEKFLKVLEEFYQLIQRWL